MLCHSSNIYPRKSRRSLKANSRKHWELLMKQTLISKQLAVFASICCRDIISNFPALDFSYLVRIIPWLVNGDCNHGESFRSQFCGVVETLPKAFSWLLDGGLILTTYDTWDPILQCRWRFHSNFPRIFFCFKRSASKPGFARRKNCLKTHPPGNSSCPFWDG